MHSNNNILSRHDTVDSYLTVGKLTVDNVESGVNDANTHVRVVQGIFTDTVGITVLQTHTLKVLTHHVTSRQQTVH